MTDSHSKERWSAKGITTRGGGMTAFLFRRSETEERPTSICGFYQLECGNAYSVADGRSSRRKDSGDGSTDSSTSRFDPGGARRALLKSPITASTTRGAHSIRSSLKLCSNTSGAKGDHRKEVSSVENMVHVTQGPLGRLAGQLTGEWRYGERCDAVETSERVFDELGSSRHIQFEETCQAQLAHGCRIHEHSWDADDGQTTPEALQMEISPLLIVDGSAIRATDRTGTLVESRRSLPEEHTGEMHASGICRESLHGDHFNRQDECPNSPRRLREGEREEQLPIREAVALAVDCNRFGDEDDPEEGFFVLEANNESNLTIEATVHESEQDVRDLVRDDCNREYFDEEDEAEAAQKLDARGEFSANEIGESSHVPGTYTDDDLTASKEDDIWSDAALISTQAKGFPPPISVLANESHPGLPSHLPRTLWRSVKRDGRFVLQELQARPREYFRATRENGRLRLQLIRQDSDPIPRNPDEIEDSQQEEGEIEIRQLGEGGRPGIAGEEGTPQEAFDRYGHQEVSNENVEKMLMNKNSEISTAVEAGQPADHNEREACSNVRKIAPGGYSSGDQSRQDFQHAHCVSNFGFDNALNLLSPRKAFFQFPLTNIRPAVR